MVSVAAKGRSFVNKYPLIDVPVPDEVNDTDVAESEEREEREEREENELKENPPTNTYIGDKEDDLWWKEVKPELPGIDEQTQTYAEIYRILVDNMGIFRWQNPQFVYLHIIYTISPFFFSIPWQI